MRLVKHPAVGHFQRIVNAMRAADAAAPLRVPLTVTEDLKDDERWGKFTDEAFWRVIIYANRNGFGGCAYASGSSASGSGPASVRACLTSPDLAPAPMRALTQAEIAELQVAWNEYHAILSGQCLPGSRTCIGTPRRSGTQKDAGPPPVRKAPDLLAALSAALFAGGTALAGFVDW